MSTTLKHRFEVQDIISQGRYSSVYRCYDKKKQRFCAVKMVLFIFSTIFIIVHLSKFSYWSI